MRRGTGTMTFGVLAADSASIAGTAPGIPAVGASACGADPACAVAVLAGASATGETAVAGGLTAIFSSRAAGTAGGLTTTPAGGGATTIIGRAAAIPAGALATTAPTGGREAMAGVAGGGAMIGAAARGCGTILRGSGRVGAAAAGVAATGVVAGGAAATATLTGGATTDAFTGPRAWRESSSFLASRAFITSPGLEMFERSILGTTGSAPWRPEAAPECVVRFASRAKCARTFTASSSSSELECVLPGGTPIPGRTSRIARDFTSSSFARSLIRTLLIRLFSMCAANRPLVVHSYSMALSAF